MPGASENFEVLQQEMEALVGAVHVKADCLRIAVNEARAGMGGRRVEDEAILERINECLSQVGFVVVRQPRSNASSGTDPWDR